MLIVFYGPRELDICLSQKALCRTNDAKKRRTDEHKKQKNSQSSLSSSASFHRSDVTFRCCFLLLAPERPAQTFTRVVPLDSAQKTDPK